MSKPKLHPVDSGDNDIVPVTVGNTDEIDDLAIDQEHLEEFVANSGESSAVECRRPPKGHFFTVLPENGKPWKNRGFYWILQIEGHDPYLVTPKIAKIKKDVEEDTIRPVLLVRYVTMTGEEGLWPVKLDMGEKVNRWNQSARNILKIAEDGKWVRIVSLKKSYRHQVSKKTFEETPPRFSDRRFRTLVDIAFEGRIVDSLNHEIWETLAQGSEK